MTKLYLITGPAGVGKSTVSELIAKKLDRSILIEGDNIYHLVIGGYVSPWKENNHMKLFWKNICNLIKNGLDENYNVIFNYIITKKEYAFLKNEFKNTDIVFKILLADEEELLKRDKNRSEENQMNDRCIVLLNQFTKENYYKKYVIDTTDMSIDNVVKEVLKL